MNKSLTFNCFPRVAAGITRRKALGCGMGFLVATRPVRAAVIPICPQIRVVESIPILSSFNAVTNAIGNAFDRDKESADFPPAIRQVIMDDLTEIRSGMLAVIRNKEGIHEGRLEDVPKILSDLRTVRALMKRDTASAAALARYRDRVAAILPTVGAKELSDPDMVTGPDLPPLLQDAIGALIPELRRVSPSSSLASTDVVLIRDVVRFGEKLRVASPLSGLSDKIRMFVIGSHLPIYVVEERPDMLAGLRLYERGRDLYLRYVFAAMLGHEWQHTLLSEHSEVKAYSFELELLHRYFADGLLPVGCADYIEKTEKRLGDARRAESNGEDLTLKLLLKP